MAEGLTPLNLVRNGYDVIADEYLSSRGESPECADLLQEFMSRLPQGARILDAACDSGVPITRRLSQSFDVTGVDLSPEQFKGARELVPQATFHCQDMTALTFPNHSYDGICSYYAIIHVPREQHPELLRTFHKLLKPGGIALLCIGTGDLTGDVNEDWLGAPMYWSHYGVETNRRMIQGCGFTVVSSELITDNHTEPPARHVFVLAEKR